MSRAARRAWDDWARVDPLWAILTEPNAEQSEAAFFASGRDAIEMILTEAQRLGYPAQHKVALDFGCGVGRLTQALAAHFETTYGVDIAPRMIERAERLARDRGVTGCHFLVQDDEDLGRFESGSVDVVCSLLVLQHLPTRELITTYVREFVRVLAPTGIAVFQLPTHIPAANAASTVRGRLGLRQRLTGFLRVVGTSPRFLYRRLGWRPAMPMSAVEESVVRDTVTQVGGRVLGVTPMAPDHGGVESGLYWVTGPHF